MAVDPEARHLDGDPGAVAARRVVTALDVEAAAHRAEEAQRRARQAHLVAAERHRSAAEAHDRAARTHREAAESGVGDVATHLKAVAVHEAARDEDNRAAEIAERMAAGS